MKSLFLKWRDHCCALVTVINNQIYPKYIIICLYHYDLSFGYIWNLFVSIQRKPLNHTWFVISHKLEKFKMGYSYNLLIPVKWIFNSKRQNATEIRHIFTCFFQDWNAQGELLYNKEFKSIVAFQIISFLTWFYKVFYL